MNELITVTETNIGGEIIQAVDARELHGILANGDHFAGWIRSRIEQYGFVNGVDYKTYSESTEKGRPRVEYAVSLDMAKELSMVERNEMGRVARRYFIECERRAQLAVREVRPSLPDFSDPAAAARAWAEQYDQRRALESKVSEDAPKVKFAEQIRALDGVCQIDRIAKTLGYGRNRFFKRLRDDAILMSNNLPYQKYLDREYFTVVEREPYTDKDGKTHATFTAMVTGAGQVFLAKRYGTRAEDRA